MTTITLPIIYYPLPPDHIVGILVGTSLQLVEKDIHTIKNKMLNYLQKIYRKDGDYPSFEIDEPKVKRLDVKVRPTYVDAHGRYPMSAHIVVPVTAVYGDTKSGHYKCYLPDFNQVFYYYDTKQFKSIFNYFTQSILNDLSVKELYELKLTEEPKVEYLSLRVKEKMRSGEMNFFRKTEYVYLDKLASALPLARPKTARQQLPNAAWELEDKVDEIVGKIIQGRANVLIVGEHGVGKSAALGLALRKITAPNGPGGKRTFWAMRSQRFVSKAEYLGEWEEIAEMLIQDLERGLGTLYILDIIRLLQIGGRSPEVSVAAFLVPFLQNKQLTMIGETTPRELESMRRLLPGFVESFQIVKIDELPEKSIQTIFQKVADYSSQRLSIKISEEALNETYRLLYRYFPYEKFPGKGIKFISKAISEAQLSNRKRITKQHILDQFIETSGMPELFLRDDMLLDTNELHQYFSEKIIGQPQALEKLSGIVKVFKAGLNNPYKPIQTLLFAGPTGVGKTASAKALANYFFGKGQQQLPLVRIEMSEFQHPHQIYKFIGGGNEVGALVKNIRERPFSVLLLDEVEKAHPGIFDALMTVLDEGIMIDNFGRVTNFRNCIIIMTTNLGASSSSSIGFGETSSEKAYQAAINRFFRPEFVNRIDETIQFNHLNQADILKICRKELQSLNEREGFKKRKLSLSFSDELVDYIASIGYDRRYGARPLQRAINTKIVEPLAVYLLEYPKMKNQGILMEFVDGEVRVGVQDLKK